MPQDRPPGESLEPDPRELAGQLQKLTEAVDSLQAAVAELRAVVPNNDRWTGATRQIPIAVSLTASASRFAYAATAIWMTMHS